MINYEMYFSDSCLNDLFLIVESKKSLDIKKWTFIDEKNLMIKNLKIINAKGNIDKINIWRKNRILVFPKIKDILNEEVFIIFSSNDLISCRKLDKKTLDTRNLLYEVIDDNDISKLVWEE